jgi:predicted amidohydrolase
VDARGKFLVPGYLDMHAHTAEETNSDQSARLMLSTGITGFRQMSGSEELLRRRAAGEIKPFADAPEVLIMPGEVLIGQIANTPEMTIADESCGCVR